MTAQLLDGQLFASEILASLGERVAALKARGTVAGLGTILVGNDPASARYVAGKHADCDAVGMNAVGIELPASSTQRDVDAAVDSMNANPDVHAYLVQYPLPEGLDFESVMIRVDPDKDADGLHPVNLGWLAMGRPAPLACTPNAILGLLQRFGVEVAGKEMVIVGRGLTIGRPLAMLAALRRPDANAAVTVVHTGVADLGDYTRRADIVVAAAGAPGIVSAAMVKPGAVVIGAGVTMKGRRIISDVDADVAEVASWVTPRVGGVGPVTRAMLLANAVDAAERASKPTN